MECSPTPAETQIIRDYRPSYKGLVKDGQGPGTVLIEKLDKTRASGIAPRIVENRTKADQIRGLFILFADVFTFANVAD